MVAVAIEKDKNYCEYFKWLCFSTQAPSNGSETVNIVSSLKMDKTAFSVGKMSDPSDEKAYWLSKTPQERLEALEIMRQILYGYDPETARIEKVLEVVQLKRD